MRALSHLRLAFFTLALASSASVFAAAGDVNTDADKDGKDNQEKTTDKKKWDVNHPPGTASTVKLDTRTGTWMTVDVSPDGKQIVFDLLGDLYLLPIAGGEAKALTHSIAWEMQARFSPDGKRSEEHTSELQSPC